MFWEGIAEDWLGVLFTLLTPVKGITKLRRDANYPGCNNVRELTDEIRQRFYEVVMSFALYSK